jgi:hypothetical protein
MFPAIYISCLEAGISLGLVLQANLLFLPTERMIPCSSIRKDRLCLK